MIRLIRVGLLAGLLAMASQAQAGSVPARSTLAWSQVAATNVAVVSAVLRPARPLQLTGWNFYRISPANFTLTLRHVSAVADYRSTNTHTLGFAAGVATNLPDWDWIMPGDWIEFTPPRASTGAVVVATREWSL
jgi:hypothetical protein